jgi:hypothetical protein
LDKEIGGREDKGMEERDEGRGTRDEGRFLDKETGRRGDKGMIARDGGRKKGRGTEEGTWGEEQL